MLKSWIISTWMLTQAIFVPLSVSFDLDYKLLLLYKKYSGNTFEIIFILKHLSNQSLCPSEIYIDYTTSNIFLSQIVVYFR